jgi:hypothetical protein
MNNILRVLAIGLSLSGVMVSGIAIFTAKKDWQKGLNVGALIANAIFMAYWLFK